MSVTSPIIVNEIRRLSQEEGLKDSEIALAGTRVLPSTAFAGTSRVMGAWFLYITFSSKVMSTMVVPFVATTLFNAGNNLTAVPSASNM